MRFVPSNDTGLLSLSDLNLGQPWLTFGCDLLMNWVDFCVTGLSLAEQKNEAA